MFCTHFRVLHRKQSSEFMILAFHDNPLEPKITKCEDPLYYLLFLDYLPLRNQLCPRSTQIAVHDALDVLCRQPIKPFQVVSTSEFHEY